MGMYELGTKPEGELREVESTHDVKVGDYYAFRLDTYIPEESFLAVGSEERVANEIWIKIIEEGDEPIYVSAEMSYEPVMRAYKVTTFVIAKRLKSSTPIHIILFAITSFLIALSIFIYVAYYIFVLKKPPPSPIQIPESVILLLILIIVLWLVRKRE